MNVHVPSTICLLLYKNVKKLNPMAHSSLPLPPYIVTHASIDLNSAACKACPTWISLIHRNIWALTTERGGKKNRKCEGRESKSGAHSLKWLEGTVILPPLPGAERGDNLGDNGNSQASPYGHGYVFVKAAKQ